MKLNQLNLKNRYLANIVAQTLCLFINCLLFYITRNYVFVWVSISALCFIGVVTSQPKHRIIDRNLVNHLITVLLYYIFSHICLEFDFVYFILIFVFTYIFFILKDSGYDKSLTTWTYIQCLLFATTLTHMTFSTKFYSTIVGWIETQLTLWLSFKLFPSSEQYILEKWIYNLKHIKLKEWVSLSYVKVQLAVRGALTAGILYLVCVLVVKDIKPNWSVIAAVACLLKDDDVGSKRTIISFILGTLIGFLISWLIIYLNFRHDELIMMFLWINMIIAVICIFEYKITLSIKAQIIGIAAVTISLTCLYLALNLNGHFYLVLRATNNIMGIIAALLAYILWILYKKFKRGI
ncbi:MAG: FUSC family protein [Neisseriaceae bacterium]